MSNSSCGCNRNRHSCSSFDFNDRFGDWNNWDNFNSFSSFNSFNSDDEIFRDVERVARRTVQRRNRENRCACQFLRCMRCADRFENNWE